MIHFIAIFQLLAAQSTVPGQIDSICRGKCEFLAVQDSSVKLIDQWLNRSVVLGRYVASGQSLVGRTEAPVLDMGSSLGWRIVASDYLDHEEDEVGIHLRFFGPDGKLRETTDVLATIVQAKVAKLAGGNEEIFAVTSNEEHAYNARTEIWMLPEHGDPKRLLSLPGDFRGFIGQELVRGLRIARQTYNGVDAKTKGTVQEVYTWHPETRSLTPESH